MRSFFATVLVFSLTFMFFELPLNLADSFHELKGHELTKADDFTLAPINTTLDKSNHTSKLNPIADHFFPIVLISSSLYEERDFTYYTPVYSLIRTKDFFLLI